jgi:hypothetical protein
MTPQDQAEANRLAKIINEAARCYVLDPAAGRRAGYQPKPTVTVNRSLLNAGDGPYVQSHILLSDWLKAIADKDLIGWRWRIDRGVVPHEVEILGRR